MHCRLLPTPGQTRWTHHQQIFRSSFPQFPRDTWEGATALGTRAQSALATGTLSPPSSAPQLCQFVAAGPACGQDLLTSPACLLQKKPRSFPTHFLLQHAYLGNASSQTGNKVSSWFPVCTTAHHHHRSALAPCSKATFQECLPMWETLVCSPTAWPSPTLQSVLWLQKLSSLLKGSDGFYPKPNMSDHSSGTQVQVPPNTTVQCGDSFMKLLWFHKIEKL